jgi:hypothetical protein
VVAAINPIDKSFIGVIELLSLLMKPSRTLASPREMDSNSVETTKYGFRLYAPDESAHLGLYRAAGDGLETLGRFLKSSSSVPILNYNLIAAAAPRIRSHSVAKISGHDVSLCLTLPMKLVLAFLLPAKTAASSAKMVDAREFQQL